MKTKPQSGFRQHTGMILVASLWANSPLQPVAQTNISPDERARRSRSTLFPGLPRWSGLSEHAFL